MEDRMGTAQAAKLLGTTAKTLQRWDREGRLVPAARTVSNRRRYTETQLRAFLRLAPAAARRVVAYCRVSSAAQRPDLRKRVVAELDRKEGQLRDGSDRAAAPPVRSNSAALVSA